MILSVSRRTDIPCCYAPWFMEHIRQGYALTRNPMNPKALYRVALTPDVVDMIVFWTKDPQGILPHLDELDGRGYRYIFQFTLTPYGSSIEKNLREKTTIEDTFCQLSQRVGKERVLWRYDPILRAPGVDVDFHKKEFARLCRKFSEYTDQVTISFVDFYRNMAGEIAGFSKEEEEDLCRFIGKIARENGIAPVACCERDLTSFGIGLGHCIDKARIERLCGAPLCVGPDKNQRNGCGCVESIDIGMYGTCPNGCAYCYATKSQKTAQRNHAAHDRHSPLLIGHVGEGETILQRKAASFLEWQTKLF